MFAYLAARAVIVNPFLTFLPKKQSVLAEIRFLILNDDLDLHYSQVVMKFAIQLSFNFT